MALKSYIELGEHKYKISWLRNVTERQAVNILSKVGRDVNQVKNAWKRANGFSVRNEDEPIKNESINLEGAIKKLNDKMNEDIDKTVNNDNTEVNQVIQGQSGGKRTFKNYKTSKKENNLTKKIRLLKLKLKSGSIEILRSITNRS